MVRLTQLAAAAATFAVGAAAAGAGEIDRLNNHTLFWGPYKPNLYFGVRQRAPQSLWTGLMWGNVDGYPEVQSSERSPKVQARSGVAEADMPRQTSDTLASKAKISTGMDGTSTMRETVAFSPCMTMETRST